MSKVSLSLSLSLELEFLSGPTGPTFSRAPQFCDNSLIKPHQLRQRGRRQHANHHRSPPCKYWSLLSRFGADFQQKTTKFRPEQTPFSKVFNKQRAHKLVCVHDTFRAVLFVRFTADTMHGRGEKPWTWPRPHLHENVAKHAGCHGFFFSFFSELMSSLQSYTAGISQK